MAGAEPNWAQRSAMEMSLQPQAVPAGRCSLGEGEEGLGAPTSHCPGVLSLLEEVTSSVPLRQQRGGPGDRGMAPPGLWPVLPELQSDPGGDWDTSW